MARSHRGDAAKSFSGAVAGSILQTPRSHRSPRGSLIDNHHSEEIPVSSKWQSAKRSLFLDRARRPLRPIVTGVESPGLRQRRSTSSASPPLSARNSVVQSPTSPSPPVHARRKAGTAADVFGLMVNATAQFKRRASGTAQVSDFLHRGSGPPLLSPPASSPISPPFSPGLADVASRWQTPQAAGRVSSQRSADVANRWQTPQPPQPPQPQAGMVGSRLQGGHARATHVEGKGRPLALPSWAFGLLKDKEAIESLSRQISGDASEMVAAPAMERPKSLMGVAANMIQDFERLTSPLERQQRESKQARDDAMLQELLGDLDPAFLARVHETATALRQLYKLVDADGSGRLDDEEVADFCNKVRKDFSLPEVHLPDLMMEEEAQNLDLDRFVDVVMPISKRVTFGPPSFHAAGAAGPLAE
eukprot:TRINITY_DN7745_c0_g2_i2.p1 TRINITY_DN7745_c0_g2~~TRINITY_DN7745_c0_g2_i2.p1  ORF type:complete len:418 (-),score=76.23 TRINITY_DN7745_c0_g2_i2:1045-2298(-)